MSIVAPNFVIATAGQDITITVTVPTDTTLWTMTSTLRPYRGGTAIATCTVGAGITNTGGATSTVVITFSAANLTGLLSGAYVWDLTRTNVGFVYAIVDTSAFRIGGSVLTNLSEYLAHTGSSETVSDADAERFTQLIGAAEAFVKRYCGRRQFVYGTYTEYFDAPLQGNILVLETPITSITSINFDATGGYGQLTDTFDSTTLLTAGSDYYFRKDNPDGKGYLGEVTVLNRLSGWNWGGRTVGYIPGLLAMQPRAIPGAIKIAYIGGYSIVPDDLKLAIWQIVADRSAAASLGGVMQSEGMEGYSYSLGAPDAEIAKIGSVASILGQYRHGESWIA
jgi:hypothetical protein